MFAQFFFMYIYLLEINIHEKELCVKLVYLQRPLEAQFFSMYVHILEINIHFFHVYLFIRNKHT